MYLAFIGFKEIKDSFFEEHEMILKSGEPLLIWGAALLDDIDDEGKQRTPKMRATKIMSLAEAQIERTRLVDINLEIPKTNAEKNLKQDFLKYGIMKKYLHHLKKVNTLIIIKTQVFKTKWFYIDN